MIDKRLAETSKSSKKKQQSAEFRTKEAIANLINSREKITVRSVARKAGVSVSYIYKYPELVREIERATEQQQSEPLASDRSALNNEEKIEQLQQENKKLLGEIKVLKDSIKKIEANDNNLKLQQENLWLTTENQQLQEKLNHTQQKLDEARESILKRDYTDRNIFEVDKR